MNPYLLPEGNVQIAFSAGRTSGYMVHQMLEANGGLPNRAKVIMTNTGREMDESLDFAQECASRWGFHLTLLEYRCRFTGALHDPRNGIFDSAAHAYEVVSHNSASRQGEPFVQLMDYFQFPPNREADYCSHELKTRTARRYCVEELGWQNWTTALGIRHDEKQRALKVQPRERYRVWYPLIYAKVTKATVSNFWRGNSFDLRLQNVRGVTPLGNCDGCFKKSEAKKAVLARDYPDRAKWWAGQEARLGGTFKSNQPWAQLIDFVDRQGDWIFDNKDILCQRNDGECQP